MRFGWWALLGFLTLGIVLEALHALKLGWYLNLANQTRRFMWTLAHAHGTLLALINIAFGAAATAMPGLTQRLNKFASPFLLASSLLLPLGFLLGGVYIMEGDPGLGILLVPPGALLLLEYR